MVALGSLPAFAEPPADPHGATPVANVASTPGENDGKAPADTVANAAAMARFLDRLMLAESGGRDDARNPRSTALGPFQFIESTFLEVARRHFQAETGTLLPTQVLQLRTNRDFARRAAEAFTRDNAAQLVAAGIPATFANLRLAFLLGPQGAVRLLKAEPQTPAVAVLGTQVVRANPFMAGMTASGLARWSARNLAAGRLGHMRVAADARSSAVKPGIVVRCNRRLASCRRWIALASRRLEARRLAGTQDRDTRE